eukprot:gene21382-24256_t
MRVLYLLCVFVLLQQVHAKAKAGQVVKEDLPYIACDVCEASITELYSATQSARSLQPKNKLDEVDIVVLIESICNPASTTGEWIRKIDIIESTLKDKRVLSLIEPGGLANCGNECATIAKSCQNLLHEEIDADELSALLWKNKSSLDEVKATVCKKWTKRCKHRRMSLPSTYNRVDEEFVAQSEKDIEMERMLEQMKAMGMGGSLYNKDDLGEMMGMDGYDEEEDGPPPNFE